MRAFLAILCLLALGGAAVADDLKPVQQPMPNQGSSGPGGLTAHDVTGKVLLDANGYEIGHIESVGPAGARAMVRTTDGKQTTVAMSRLSLGNGPNTVIMSGDSGADRLNKMQLGH